MEINQRLSLLNQRLDVIGDLVSSGLLVLSGSGYAVGLTTSFKKQLHMLKEQMSHSQGEHLEWIVIILIAAEILVAVINVVVDLMAAN